jgi:hypothetical protein
VELTKRFSEKRNRGMGDAPVTLLMPEKTKEPDVSESPTGRLDVPTAPALQNMKPEKETP